MSGNDKTIGFLGCGSMGSCILNGIIKAAVVPADKIYVCNRTESKVKSLCTQYGVKGALATDLAQTCDIIFIGVKPYGVTAILDLISSQITSDKLVVSMAAGVNIDTMQKHLPPLSKIIRVMPNVPCLVGCGMTSVTPNAFASDADTAAIVKIFEAIGKAAIVAESGIHGVVAVAGSSPAYTFMFMESLADGAVQGGIPRAQAYELAAQAVIGAARMLQETGKAPGDLKDMVCSPGGTTIEAVRSLEKGGLRSAVIEAMVQCMNKSKEMEELYKS